MKSSRLKIFEAIRQGTHKSSELAVKLKLSRQAIAQHLAQLVAEAKIVKEGSTRSAQYYMAQNKRPSAKMFKLKFSKNLKSLEEDLVFAELSLRANLKSRISHKSFQIIQYAFTEMLNNAIDHSGAKSVNIEVGIENQIIYFIVHESGRGIFAHVSKKYHLNSEFEAMEHVLKGKQTTDPSRHSGQGIFFTSRLVISY